MVLRSRFIRLRTILGIFALGIAWLASSADSFGQGGGNNNNFGFNRVVGGISVDANGVITGDISKLTASEIANLTKAISNVDPKLDEAGMRAVSLKAIQAALADAAKNNTNISPEIQFMAGLTRIEFVVVKPETNDLLLVGPADGWKVNDRGAVVSKTSGHPVLMLEDFLVAMRTVDNARSDYGISVDIRPTDEGMVKYNEISKGLASGRFNSSHAAQIEEAVGPQPISVTGVPLDSHFAQVLVAADYRLKQLSMGLTKSPIAKFPSVMEMFAQKGGLSATIAPRFWLECNYDAVSRSEDGNVWRISGPGAKALTQETYYDKDGKVVEGKAAKKNKTAETWAEMMTKRYEELSDADPIFRELRNIMDMSVIAAIISKENVLEKANLDASEITQLNSSFTTPVWHNPESVPSKCVFVGNMVSVSGGIQVDSWAVAANQKVDASLANVANAAAGVNIESGIFANVKLN
ncbi:MAG: DUF1598 domain-containing protein [Pirellulaceae bacterium]